MGKAKFLVFLSAALLILSCQTALAADIYDEQGNTVIDEVGSGDIPRLIELLGNPDGTVRFKARTFLVMYGGQSVQALLDSMAKGQNRLETVRTLREIKDPSSISTIFKYVDDADPEVSLESKLALIDMQVESGPYVVERLAHKEKTRASVYILSNMARTDQMALDLRKLLSSSDAELRSASVFVLGEWHDEGSLKEIAALLRDENKDVRKEALEAYQKVTDKYDQNVLLALLKDADAEVRSKAADMLAEDKDADPSLIEGPLLDAARNDSSNEVRANAIYALGEHKINSAIMVFLDALKDDDWQVKGAALGAIEALDAKEAVPYIMELIKDRKIANNKELKSTIIVLLALDVPVDIKPFVPYIDSIDSEEGAHFMLLVINKYATDEDRPLAIEAFEKLYEKSPDGTLKTYLRKEIDSMR